MGNPGTPIPSYWFVVSSLLTVPQSRCSRRLRVGEGQGKGTLGWRGVGGEDLGSFRLSRELESWDSGLKTTREPPPLTPPRKSRRVGRSDRRPDSWVRPQTRTWHTVWEGRGLDSRGREQTPKRQRTRTLERPSPVFTSRLGWIRVVRTEGRGP